MNRLPLVDGIRVVRARARALAILSLAFVLFVAPFGDQPAAGQAAAVAAWTIQTVDTNTSARWQNSSLALDAAGNPHVAISDGNLKYAVRTGQTWTVQTLDTTDWPWNVSLAVDAGGNPFIAYVGAQSTIKYTYRTGGQWQTQVLEDNREGTGASIVLDAAGVPHIAYAAGVLKYAYLTAAGWHTEIVDTGSHPGEDVSLALDSAGRPHITYCNMQLDGCVTVQYAHWTGSEWLFETVDYGMQPSIAVDGQDLPHIAYTGVRYAVKNASGWTAQAVEPGSLPSLKLDGLGGAHLAYEQSSVEYASLQGSTWITQTVYSSGQNASLALTAAGSPALTFASYGSVYYAEPGAGLSSAAPSRTPVGAGGAPLAMTRPVASPGGSLPRAYAAATTAATAAALPQNAGGWQIQTVDSAGDAGWWSRLVLDPAGKPHIIYHTARVYAAGDPSGLRYAEWNGSTWVTQDVRTGDLTGNYPTLALDSAGNPHVAFMEYALGVAYPGDLVYLYRSDGVWQGGTVDEKFKKYTNGLALDASGAPIITVFSSAALEYYVPAGSSWDVQVIANAGPERSGQSLALDATGAAHVSFYDSVSGHLLYASQAVTGWTVQVVDPLGLPPALDAAMALTMGVVPFSTSLALDRAGRPHISYYDPAHGALKYAHWNGAAWQVQTVDGSGKAGRSNSLALDGNDRPVIGYSDESHGDLRLAYRLGSTWLSETVDSAGWAGLHNSLAIDPAGRVHLSYYERMQGDLKYAVGGPVYGPPVFLPLLRR